MAEFKHTVTKEDEGKEVRDIMRMYFDFSSRLRNKVKREKLVFLNGEQTQGWYKVYPGDVVSVELPEEKSNFPAQPIPLDPVFEDDDLLLLNKQPGLIVHPTKGHPLGTVANALMHYQEVHGQSWKIRFVNRLDMDTSGLLIVAKNAYCQSCDLVIREIPSIRNKNHTCRITSKHLVRKCIYDLKSHLNIPPYNFVFSVYIDDIISHRKKKEI